jgi:hypothetical protein
MKKISFVCLIFVLVVSGYIYLHLRPSVFATYQYSSNSIDKKYNVDVYSYSPIIAFPGGGGAGSKEAFVVLRNDWGWEIGSSSGCDVLMDDIKIDWETDEKSVSFAKTASIEYSTGKCSY